MVVKGMSPLMTKQCIAGVTAAVLDTTCKRLLFDVQAKLYLAFPFCLEHLKARPGQLYLLGCHVNQMGAQS